MTEPAFDFAKAVKAFRVAAGQTVRALDGLTCRGATGAITCLVGPTGCGKTTALRMAAGLAAPDEGRVRVHGISPVDACRTLGYIPQQHTLFPWLRIQDNVAFPLRMRGVGRAERRRQADELLARVGLAGRGRAHPHECSGGMQQRVMLARQLATGATHWLLDEPFASLDERTRHHLQHLLLELRRDRDLSILFVTHSIEEAVFLADRIVLLSPGPGRVIHTLDLAENRLRDRLSTAFAGHMESVRRSLESAIRVPCGGG